MKTLRHINSDDATHPDVTHRRHFDTDHLLSDIKGRSVRGGATTLAVQTATFLMKIASIAVLARLLTPADFGLIAMVAALSGTLGRVKTMGLPSATVQRQTINHRQVSTLFWINCALSGVLTLAIAALGPAIAWFYQDPRLTLIAVALSGAILLEGLALQHRALLRRQMRFGALAAIDVTALASGLAVAIVLALLGAHYWALIAMTLGHALVQLVLVWLLCDWRPGLPSPAEGLGSMLAFGGNVTGASLLNRVCQSLDNVFIGFAWGAGPLGLYSRAYSLLKLPRYQISAAINKVALPTLSRLQGDPDDFRRFFGICVAIAVGLGLPITLFSLVNARQIVVVLLGESWLAAVPIFQLLAPAAFIGILSSACNWIYLPLGRSNRQVRCVFYRTVLTVVAYVIGLPWGPIGVAAAFVISRTVLILPELMYAFHGTPVSLVLVAKASWRAVVASTAAAAALLGFQWYVSWELAALAGLTLDITIFSLAYFATWSILPGGWPLLRKLFRLKNHFSSQAAANSYQPDRDESTLTPLAAPLESCPANSQLSSDMEVSTGDRLQSTAKNRAA